MMIEGGNGTDVFRGEISPCEHLVQIYDDGGRFLDSLAAFVGEGLAAGEGVVVILTSPHRTALETRLQLAGLELESLRREDRYVNVDASDTLTRFMVNGWPDRELFDQLVRELIARARGDSRRVRAFGEMAALLWGGGEQAATLRLEQLWHALCQSENFALFCAYPRVGFTQDVEASMAEICAAHTRVLAV
jgi:hypothetical protein